MKNSKLKKNFLYQFTYRVLTVLTPLITAPYLSRTLGPDNLGIYSATYAYANYFLLFAMLGVEFYGNRTIASCSNDSEKVKQTFWNIYSVQAIAAVLSITVYYVSIIAMGGPRLEIRIVQGIWIIAAGADINWFFFGKQDFKLTVTRNIIIKLITIACIFVFIKRPEDLIKYAFIMSFGMLVGQIVMWILLARDTGFIKPEKDEVRKAVRPIIKLFIPVLAMSVFHIMDKTMVDILSDTTNGGCYYNADRLVNIPLGVVTGLNTVMLPRIAKDIISNKSGIHVLLNKSGELTICISSAIAFGIGAIAKEFVPVFFGPGFELCIVLLEIFTPIIIIKAISDYIRQEYVIPVGKDKLNIIAVSTGAAVNLIANYYLISWSGAKGAVIGTLIAESIVLFIQIVGVKQEIDFVKIIVSKSIYIGFGALMLIAVRIASKHIAISAMINLIILICIGALVYTTCCCIYWSFRKDSIFHDFVKPSRLFK